MRSVSDMFAGMPVYEQPRLLLQLQSIQLIGIFPCPLFCLLVESIIFCDSIHDTIHPHWHQLVQHRISFHVLPPVHNVRYYPWFLGLASGKSVGVKASLETLTPLCFPVSKLLLLELVRLSLSVCIATIVRGYGDGWAG